MQDGEKILAVDPGFGSSKFAIVGIERLNGILYVKEARQFDRPSTSVMIDMVAGIYHRDGYHSCYVDGSQPGLIQDWQNGSTDGSRKAINTQPVNFRQELNTMLAITVKVVKEQKARIHPSFADLISQLKTVQFNQDGHPDKKRLSFDIGDAFMMATSKAETSAGGASIVIAGPFKRPVADDRSWMWK
jgi:hypothetical protein